MRSGDPALGRCPRPRGAGVTQQASPTYGPTSLRGEDWEGSLVEVLTLFIAVLALVIAVIAYMRTGGIQDLRRQVDSLGSATESVRERTADVFSRVERLIRGREKSSQEQQKEGEENEHPPPA